jgi:hypothetical protein
MRLYKYKSLAGDGLLHALDMIVNRRIFLPTSDMMNDPAEGGFENEPYPEDQADHYRSEYERLRIRIENMRFTSFSANGDNPLLWAHYAGGFSGVAFEYEIPENHPDYVLLPVRYKGSPSITFDICQGILNENKAVYDYGILLSKRQFWSYENEHRLFMRSTASYFPGITPTGIIMGGKNYRHDSIFTQIARKFGIKTGHLMEVGDEYKIYYPKGK